MISREEVENLAVLARLKLSPEDVAGLQKDISNILDYVGQISAVSAEGGSGGKPALYNSLREDAPRAEGDTLAGKEEALRSAFPKREGNFNSVRKILDKQSG